VSARVRGSVSPSFTARSRGLMVDVIWKCGDVALSL
jgi:hypothetical protein